MIDANLLFKKSIANSLTLLNLFLGFVSIVLISISISNNNDYNLIIYACNLIFIASIIDMLDGKIARKLGISSDFGKQLDSLADLVSFCAAPSFLIFSYYYELIEINFILLSVLSSLTLLTGAIRLAKFNISDKHSNNDYYIGLPTPANAIFICSLILYMYNLPQNNITLFFSNNSSFDFFNILNYPLEFIFFNNVFMVLVFYIFTSILLVSNTAYFKFTKLSSLDTKTIIGFLIFFILFCFGFFKGRHDIVLLFFILVYISRGVLNYFYLKISKKG
tara:strand:- start:310 stop:1140 length:831 start_codon:yes stop_codon:yes gene_type:complete